MTAYVCGKDDPIDFDTFMALYTAVKLGGDDEDGQQLCRDAFQRVTMTLQDIKTLVDFDPYTLGGSSDYFDTAGRMYGINMLVYGHIKTFMFKLSLSFINVGGMNWLKSALKKKEKEYAANK